MAHDTGTVKNPGSLKDATTLKGVYLGLAVAGLAGFGFALTQDRGRAWASFVLNHFYFLSLAIGGLFFAATQWVTGAMWSAPVRRVSESLTAYLPIGLVTFAILYFGLHDLYIWTHPEHVRGDIVLEGKASYLSVPFFMIRNILAIGAWIFFARKMVGNSLAQDVTGEVKLTEKNRALSPGFLIVFAITYTMASFDTLMSLDPHWFSTMFGVYCFSGMFYAILALTAIITIFLKRRGLLEGIVNKNHLHDLGQFMFAFTIFYAYIGFSQFMLIWYANLPEETGYFIHRFSGQWLYVSIFLLVGKFLVPFFLLLPRDAKRSEKTLMRVGIFMMIAHWIDVMWMVQPEFFRQGPKFGWIELTTLIGFTGLFGTMILRFLSRHTVVALGDPRLKEAVFKHHQ